MLRQQLDNDFTTAVKARDAFAVSVLRMLRAAMKNAEIEKREELSEDEILALMKSEVKKLRDALEQFKSGGRDDLVQKNEQEIAFLGKYLPAQLDDTALRAIVKTVIVGLGEVTPKDFGRVMSAVMKEAKGQADGGRVSALVKEALNG
ncbi:GatB/YqeY domain-containing protein [Patescibacteria group bacterium]